MSANDRQTAERLWLRGVNLDPSEIVEAIAAARREFAPVLQAADALAEALEHAIKYGDFGNSTNDWFREEIAAYRERRGEQ